ncbi:MAG: 30S ribosomal protein S2, partial [Ignavibacteriales bacterium]|nr:30S ribosomal protein S2 [Ignavibacteriales bacterium]
KLELSQLIEAGAHFGHLTRRWNPKMKPYIFMEKNGIHIIDLKKTIDTLEKTVGHVTEITSTGKKMLFVGTKRQAKVVITEEAKRSNSHWVSERWLGGMLTNFSTIRKSVKRMQNIEKMEGDGTFEKITKKEILELSREKEKLKKILEGVEDLNRLPGALFVVDIKKESIAIKEARRLNIPIFAIVDTNCDPDDVDYLIPANDDAVSTISIITKAIADAVLVGEEKAKELRAHETAEKERVRKESDDTHEEEKKDAGQPKTRKVRVDFKDKRGKDKPFDKSSRPRFDKPREDKKEDNKPNKEENK